MKFKKDEQVLVDLGDCCFVVATVVCYSIIILGYEVEYDRQIYHIKYSSIKKLTDENLRECLQEMLVRAKYYNDLWERLYFQKKEMEFQASMKDEIEKLINS